MGRPTRLTPEIAKAIEDRVRLGASLSAAGESIGVATSVACEWMERGEGRSERGKRQIYVDFAEQVRKAQAEDQLRRIGRIEQAGKGGQVVARETITKPTGETIIREKWSEPQWVADMTHLERRYPQDWARHSVTEHTGPGGGPIQLEEVATAFYARVTRILARLPAALPAGGHGQPDAGGA